MKICSGTFTKANNKIVGEKSALDYGIASDELIRYIKYMQIDIAKQFTPWCTLKSGKRFSDHNAVILKVEYNKIPSQSKSDRKLCGISITQKVGKGSINSQVQKIF